MKRIKLLLALILSVMFIMPMTACNTDSKVAKVSFWGWGAPSEITVFKELVNTFNKMHEGEIEVKYQQKPSDGFTSATAQALSGRSGPDVAYVGDGSIKQWAALNLLEPLDTYLATSTEIVPDDIWSSALQRYRLDKDTMQSRPTDPLYAVPKDIGPTVIYYNKDAMKHSNVGVTIISIDEEAIDDYNSANGTSYEKRGYNPATKVFNNRIAMTWDDSIVLFKLLTQKHNSSSPTQYGYFTEWWFSYGWSVGGDCIQFDGTNWQFSLGDKTQLYQKDGEFFKTQVEGSLPVPTMYDAFTHFVQLSQPTNKDVTGSGDYGFEVTPSPNTLGTQGKVGYFTSGKVAMLVDGRFATVDIREHANFDWDVAPLPKAENGIEAGHSGSMGMAINRKSKVKDAAWKFCEFIAGQTGQAEQAKTGFNIPNQKSIASTDVFLQPNEKPANASIFIKAAEIQTAGDWWYLSDGLWIDQWAPLLNGDVRNGKIQLPEFFSSVTTKTNNALREYTK